MRDLNEDNLTQAVLERISNETDPRLREILTSLIRHLHAFIREVRLTEDEWMAGIQFLTATGQRCDEERQEFVLLSDTLGATTLKDFLNHRQAAGITEYTILGPFFRQGAPDRDPGENIAAGLPGEPILVSGRVTSSDGKPIAEALLDIWQASAGGFYDVQDPALPAGALRGRFRTAPDGTYGFVTIKPSSYPIPYDGPVGTMLRATGRHPYRPAHIHFMIMADGFVPVTTELFVEGDPYLNSDAVFGVRESLVVAFPHREGEAIGGSPSPPAEVRHDFVLERSG